MKVCIVGGGNIGTSLVCHIKHTYPEYDVRLYTRRPERFAPEIKCNDIEQDKHYSVMPDTVSGDAGIAARGANIIFIALPHFAVEKAFSDIAPFVADDAMIGVLPGGGGNEFFFHKYFTPRQVLFGFQRVPFVSRLREYGKEVDIRSWKPFNVVATLQHDRLEAACQLIEACGLKTKKAGNYLEIALTPSNPILHTSRIYDLFGQHDRNHVYKEKQMFYVGWTNNASNILFAMDKELHCLLDAITSRTGLDTDAICPLSEHYESPTCPDLTAKINGIASFQGILAPMTETSDGFVADTTSRMFTEDFPWGLAIFRSYFSYFNIPAPTMDKVLGWYASYMGIEWFVDEKFCGKDLDKTGIIPNYGIKDTEELMKIYR